MRIIIGVPHCRFLIHKASDTEATEFFAIHKQTPEGFLGLAIRTFDVYDESGIHSTAEILETFTGLSYSKLAEKVKNLSKAAIRAYVDEMSANTDVVTPVEFQQSRFGREAASIFEDEEDEVKQIFKERFGPIRSELSELILGIDELAAYKGVQGSW